jgi:hypothetical protein
MNNPGSIMQTVMKIFSGAVVLAMAAMQAALAVEPWEPGGSLDTCIEAALKQRPGILTSWQQSGGGEEAPYVIGILNPEGNIAEAFCDPTNPANLQFTSKKMGLYRYSMFQRATWPESRARSSAPEIFTGPVRLTSMELSVSFAGRPAYTYQMLIPDNLKASVEIDGVTGRLEKAQVNR